MGWTHNFPEVGQTVTTTLTDKVSTRRRLAETLLRVPPEGGIVSFDSVAKTMGASPSILSRYLRGFRQVGWIETRKTMGLGLWVKVLDRDSLAVVAQR